MIPRAAASAERIQEVLDTESSVVDTLTPKTPSQRTGTVEFRDVEFRYPGAEHPILSDISFTAEPGKVTAIVGSTGSGKTTIDRKSTRLNSSHRSLSRMPSSA